MIHIKANKIDWQKEPGYARGVLFPYGNELDPGVQVQINTFEPGGGAGNHKHLEQTEFIYCLEGRLKLTFREREVIFEPGDLLVIESGDEHAAENIGESAVKLLTVKINGSPDDTEWLE
jgi:quercetin dioxygenase-like cupin family protein